MDSKEPVQDDPEIIALLDFEPCPRSRIVKGSWTPELQREFIARLAVTGSPGRAAEEMGKTDTGVRKLYRTPEGAGFRAAWHAAIEIAKRRWEAGVRLAEPVSAGSRPPSVDNRRRNPVRAEEGGPGEGLPGQVLNEHGEWEDEDSYLRRGEEAMDSIGMKLVRCRRAFLQEISGCAGKRAAFEILTELPVDWELAKRLKPQPFEPWTPTNQRQPDMVLSNECGWSVLEGYGADRRAEARREIDEYRAEQGLEPVDWAESAEAKTEDGEAVRHAG